jgi:hypothetical protein
MPRRDSRRPQQPSPRDGDHPNIRVSKLRDGSQSDESSGSCTETTTLPPLQSCAPEKETRQLMRERGVPVRRELSLQDRDYDVRLSLPASAHDVYDEVPDATPAVYFPTQHVVVLDLPQPNQRGDN